MSSITLYLLRLAGELILLIEPPDLCLSRYGRMDPRAYRLARPK
jgi:hypothetical protein